MFPETRLPSFLVLGPPRTGTSWLHKILAPHVALPSPSKETRFFDLHFHRGLDWYRWHFPRSRHQHMAEIAPTYFASPNARGRIAAVIPETKLIITLRHPVERVLSLYRVKRAYGHIPWSLEEALERDPELIQSGLYCTHLGSWLNSFAPDQILVLIYEDLISDPQAFLDTITEFVGLARIAVPPSLLERVYSSEKMTQPFCHLATRTATVMANWCKARRLDHFVRLVRESNLINVFLGNGKPLPTSSPQALGAIASLFRSEVEGIERIIGRNLEGWKQVASNQRAVDLAPPVELGELVSEVLAPELPNRLDVG